MPRTALLIATALFLAFPANASAAFGAGTAGLTGQWNVAANGTGDTVPGPGDAAYLGMNDGKVVTLSGAPASVAVVYGGSHFRIDGTSLSVSGVLSAPGPDVTSFEDTSGLRRRSIAITGPAMVQGGSRSAAAAT